MMYTCAWGGEVVKRMARKVAVNLSSLQEAEGIFWAKVWRCDHGHPCAACCWPWTAVDCTANWQCVWQQPAVFSCKVAGEAFVLSAPRFAYEARGGFASVRTKKLHAWHHCFFTSCCNPCHVQVRPALGPRQVQRRSQQQDLAIVLPDGRQWTYAQACTQQAAFYEAQKFQRVFAGEIPATYRSREDTLNRPALEYWPRKADLRTIFIHVERKQPAEERLFSWKELRAIQHNVRRVLDYHRITLDQLYRYAMLDIDQLLKGQRT